MKKSFRRILRWFWWHPWF